MVWDMCMLKRLFFSEPCCSSTQCFVMSCMLNPLWHYTDFIKFTKIKTCLAFSISQISVLNFHDIGLLYIIAVWWNSGVSEGILISCCRRAHTSVFQINLRNSLSEKETVWLLYFERHVKPRLNNVIKSEHKWRAVKLNKSRFFAFHPHFTSKTRLPTFARHIDS